ncbi:MAG: SgcJ/EcaC family oxidoreductase [Woeseiaceae bacterium]|nr:SgcJ/EcaC family oxidoreductase [Woeseiaceae bacterium]
MLKYAIGAALLFTSLCCFAQSDDDKAAILATFESWNQGWATRDAALAVEDYAHDVDWTNAFGDRFEGKESLQKGLEYIFSLDFVMAGDSAGNEYTDIRFLSDDIAIVRSKLVRSGQQESSGAEMPDRHVNHLRVYERRSGRWVIVSHLISEAKEKR